MSNAQDIPYGYCQCGCGQKTRLAPADDHRHGHVKGQPVRFLRGHQFRGIRKEVRWLKEDRGYQTPCWIWQLAIDANGYGHDGYGYRSRPGKSRGAHRVMWERVNGPVPKGMYLDHLCRVRRCVNPEHLEVVTPAENCRRGINSKVTHEIADEIRVLYAAGGVTHRELAKRYGVSHNRIGHIVRGEAWTTGSQST